MNIKKILSISCLFISALIFINAGIKGEKDPLHKRNFNLGLTEIKDGQPQKKNIKDELSFKDGKLYFGFLAEKQGLKWLKYRINKDSIYVDETETEVRLLEVECTHTDESNQTTTIFLKVEDWDIEGYIKITKNDKPKKYYDFVGREKGGKPKKEKKPKGEQPKPADPPADPPKQE